MHLDSFSFKDDSENENEENEANIFAGHFLMPDGSVRKEWNDAFGLHPVDRVMKVKSIFRVSYKTILRRLIDNGVADANIWAKFNFAFQNNSIKSFSLKRNHSQAHQKFGMERFDFYEDRLSLLTRQTVEAEAISISRGAEILQISIEEMMELLSDYNFDVKESIAF
jgi:Zn-dependent peptidase ImmA (M78 family)